MSRNQTSGNGRRASSPPSTPETPSLPRAEGTPTSSSVTAAGAAERASSSWRGSGAHKAAVRPPAVTDFFYFGPAGSAGVQSAVSGAALAATSVGSTPTVPINQPARAAASAPCAEGGKAGKGTAARAGLSDAPLGSTDLSLDYDPPPLDGGPLDDVLGLLHSLRCAARDCREAAAPCPDCRQYVGHFAGCAAGGLS